MRKKAFLIALFVSGAICLQVAQAAEQSPLDAAARALDENLPEVAIQKLKVFLAKERAEPERKKATMLLARALLREGKPWEARQAIAALEATKDPAVRLLAADCLAAGGDWQTALERFHELGSASPELARSATLGEAQALRALGRLPEAMDVLARSRDRKLATPEMELLLAELLLDTGQTARGRELLDALDPPAGFARRWKEFLNGRALLAEDRTPEALDVFKQMLSEPDGLSESLYAGATLGRARAEAALGSPDPAADLLEDFIKVHQRSACLAEVFARLDRMYAELKDVQVPVLRKWAQKDPPERNAFSLYYLARVESRDNKPEKAIERLDRFLELYPKHQLVPEALFFKARLLVSLERFDDALSTLDAAVQAGKNPARVALMKLIGGAVRFRLGDFDSAAALFRDAADRSPDYREMAIFDVALARLHNRSYDAFVEDYRELSAQFPESALRRELVLEEGLLRVRDGDPEGPETLTRFTVDFPDNPRVPEAYLALAEKAYFSLKPDEALARRYLRVANETSTDPTTANRAAYLEIFLKSADPAADPAKVIEACRAFIDRNPGADLVPDVRMKLGDLYYRVGDFGNARTQFEIVAKEFPKSPHATAALFLAGRAAAKSMDPDRALELFEEVARKNGPMKPYARLEQAGLKSRVGDDLEAIILYDNVLKEQPEPEVRYAAMAGRGVSLLALGQKEPKYIEPAIALFDTLASEPDVPPFWRNQALYRKGSALQALNKPAEALTAFYDVLQASTAAPQEAELFWYYKAGFEAARMLEQQLDWKGAVAIYKKIALLRGPRAEEVEARLTRLRLEHFIWEE